MGNTNFTGYPTDYINGAYEQSGGLASGASGGQARRESTLATDNPTAFTIDQSDTWRANVIAIRSIPASLAGKTAQIRYDVRGRAGKTAQILYNVLSATPVAGKTAQIRYDVKALAGKQGIILYNVESLPDLISIPYDGLSEEQREQAILRGNYGQIEFNYRMYKSNISGDYLQEIETVENASISLDNFREHTWELQLPMDYVDYFDIWKDWVRLEVEMSAGGYTVTRPFGLYFFDHRAGADSPMRRRWELDGKSQEARLMGSGPDLAYSAAAGTGVLANVRTILLAQGVPANMIFFPPTAEDVALQTTFFVDSFQNSNDARWLRICNLLLAAGGFLALFADNEGRLCTRKINPDNRIQASMTYGTTEDADRMIVGEEMPWEYDDANFYNRVVVHSGDPNEAASFGVAENHDPGSRVSREELGYWKQQDIELPALVSASEAQIVAVQALRVSSGLNVKRSVETNFDTRVKPRQAYGLETFGDHGEEYTSGYVWPVMSVSATLDLSPMSHEVQVGVML